MSEEIKDLKIIQTGPGELGKAGWDKFKNNTIKFVAPIAIIYLGFVVGNAQDGIQASDFVPNVFVQGGIATYIGGVLLDFFRKYTQEQTYIVPKKE
jgi:hypothetical protein